MSASTWPTMRSRFIFQRRDIRGANAPLASATKDGVLLRDDLDISVWNPESDISNYKLVEPGDFVIGLRSFQHGISHSKVRGIVSPAYTVLRGTSKADPRFFKYYFRSAVLISHLANLTQGIRQGQTIDMEAFANLELPVPQLDEQRRIADFLDAETTRIDALIDQKRRVIALIEERTLALVNKITPGAISFSVDGRPNGITGMQCVRLGSIAEVNGGFTIDAGRDTTGDSVTLPYLRVANVQDGALSLNDVKEVTLPRTLAKRCTLRSGDVLMTEGGDPDKLGRGTVWSGDIQPCLHQNAIFAVRPNPQKLLPEYLALVTRTRYARAYFEMTASKATGIAHTSSTKITSFRVPMCTIAEQHKVILEIQEALARIYALRAPAERQLALMAERRQALITAAVTGGITV